MAQFLLKRSGTADKRPDPAQMVLGELDLNYDAITGGVFYKDSGGTVVKIGPAQVSATAPNATPAGSAGNALGEFWYDTGSSALCIWNGSAWAVAGGSGIPCACITGQGALITGTAASTPVALAVGTAGQVLTVDLTCSSGLKWATPGSASNATPTVAGSLLGCSTADVAAVGCNALLNNTATGMTAVGSFALCANTSGANNTAIGSCSMRCSLTGGCNTAIGVCTLFSSTSASNNTAIGYQSQFSNNSGTQNTSVGVSSLLISTGNRNTAIGALAGCNITTGSLNVVIGCGVTVGAPAGSCQLTIGFATGCNWLTGCSNKNIRPGAGILDAGDFAGHDGQFLVSTGANGLCWSNRYASQTVYGTVLGYTVGGGTFLGDHAGFNINGVGSVAVGQFALSGGACFCNTAFGSQALAFTTGCSNTGIGINALRCLEAANSNTALGANAGCSQTAGSSNVAIGAGIELPSLTGSCQLAIGFAAGCCWLTGCSDRSIRPAAGIVDCAGATGTDGQVLMSNGSNALCWGTVTAGLDPALLCCSNAEGCGGLGGNLIYGQYSDGTIYPTPLYPGYAGQILCSTGNYNKPLAYCNANYVCGACFTQGSIPVGRASQPGGVGGVGINGTGNNPGVPVGYYTDIPLTGGSGTGVTANVNVIFTPYFPVLDSVQIVNPGSGYLVGDTLTITIDSTTLNYTLNVDALNSSTVYNYTMLSVGADGTVLTADSSCTNGVKWNGPGQASNCNTLLGANAGTALTSGANNILIGCCAGTTTGGVSGALTTESNRIVMGNSAHTCAQIQVAWSTTSDVRDKALDFAGVPYGLLFVEQLEPIAYRFCDRETNKVTDEKLRYGFSAQNVRALEGDTPVITSDENPEKLTITDQHLLPVLVNAIKELSERNRLLEERIAALEDKA